MSGLLIVGVNAIVYGVKCGMLWACRIMFARLQIPLKTILKIIFLSVMFMVVNPSVVKNLEVVAETLDTWVNVHLDAVSLKYLKTQVLKVSG